MYSTAVRAQGCGWVVRSVVLYGCTASVLYLGTGIGKNLQSSARCMLRTHSRLALADESVAALLLPPVISCGSGDDAGTKRCARCRRRITGTLPPVETKFLMVVRNTFLHTFPAYA